MKFKIPLTFSDTEILKRRSKFFVKFTNQKRTKLDEHLEKTEEKIDKSQYLSICYRSFLFNLFFSSIIVSTSLVFLRKDITIVPLAFLVSFLIAGFILFKQRNYPRLYGVNKSRDIDRNLIPALQDMIVQLDSGVPIFKILINISTSDYGQVSQEFKKMAKEINSGTPQIEAIEKYGKLNTSEYFRRVLWQVSNGMRAGSDISMVIKENIRTLNAEQNIQIQSYGNKLNPIIMFYMLIAVILPSLGITFFIIISSLLNVPEKIVQLIFFFIFSFVVFMQIMFLGVIKSRRPSLL